MIFHRIIIAGCILASFLAIYSPQLIGVAMAQLGQAPESGQHASFLHRESSFKIIESGTVTVTKPANQNTKIEQVYLDNPAPNNKARSVIAYAGRGTAQGEAFQCPVIFSEWTAGNVTATVNFNAFSDHIDFYVETPTNSIVYGVSYTWTFKYYVFEADATIY